MPDEDNYSAGDVAINENERAGIGGSVEIRFCGWVKASWNRREKRNLLVRETRAWGNRRSTMVRIFR